MKDFEYEFSVIIPLYNKEKEISNTVKSVLNQKFSDFEIIIINDGSTDNSLNEVGKFTDKRLSIYNKTNQGVSNARNYGIEKAVGKYIALLDGDDIWHINFLSEINKLIKLNPDCRIFGTEYTFNETDLNSVPSDSVERTLILDYFKRAKFRPLLTSSSIVIDRNCIGGDIVFNTQFSSGEDLDVWAQLFKKYKQISFSNQILVYYKLDANDRASYKPVELDKTQTFYLNFEAVQSFDEKQYYIYRIANLLWAYAKSRQLNDCFKLLKKYPYKMAIIIFMIKYYIIFRSKRKS